MSLHFEGVDVDMRGTYRGYETWWGWCGWSVLFVAFRPRVVGREGCALYTWHFSSVIYLDGWMDGCIGVFFFNRGDTGTFVSLACCFLLEGAVWGGVLFGAGLGVTKNGGGWLHCLVCGFG